MSTAAATPASIPSNTSWGVRQFIAEQEPSKLVDLLEGEFSVLEMIAEAAPLAETLDTLMRVLERQADGMLCSLLLLSEDGKHVRHGAAPSLPDFYNRAVEGAPIGPRAGSCGTAAYSKKQVVVRDIAIDPLWAEWKDLALAAGLRACWSTPVFSKRGEVLGTFAMYYKEPMSPTPLHRSLITMATHLASIAIEREFADRDRQQLVRELAAQRVRLSSIIEQLPAAVVVADTHGRLVLGNRRVDEIFGHPMIQSDSIEGYREWGLCQIDGKPSDPHELPLARSLEHGETVVGYELIARWSNDLPVFISVSSAPIRDSRGQICGAVAAFWDISDKKRAEQERERLLDELRTAVRARDDFLAVASHELRTPLSSLRLYADSLARSLTQEPLSLDGLQHKMGSSLKQIVRLERLINDLLDVSKISAGRLPLSLETVDIAEVVADVVERFSHNQRSNRLVFHRPASVVGRWDPGRLDQVLSNLISNALKYGLDKPVVVGITRDTTIVRVSVCDQGIGIPAELRERIFDRFTRCVSDSHYGGLGLGLWIARQIVEAHGGTLRVDSAPNRGATFTVDLPVGP